MKTAFEAAGDLRSVDLFAAFVTIWRERWSGSLRFSRGPASAGYDLADGEIVSVFSSEPRFETAAILIRAGKLDPSAVERLSVPPGADAALAALGAGVLTRREWKWGEKIRAIEILADLVTWPDGKYLLDRDARPDRGDFALAVPRLLLELFLRSRDRGFIQQQLGPTDVPLARSETFEEDFATFGLTADAESVVRLIDGRTTAEEISERAPAEEFAVLKLLAAFRALGLLRREVRPEAAQPELPPEEAFTPPVPEPSPFESWSSPEPALPAAAPAERPSLADMPLEEDAARDEGPDFERSSEEARSQAPPVGESLRPRPKSTEAEWEDAQQPSLAEPLAAEVQGRPARSWGLRAGIFILFLVVAVAGIVILRSRTSPREPASPVRPEPTMRVRRSVPAPVSTSSGAAAPPLAFTAPPSTPAAPPLSTPGASSAPPTPLLPTTAPAKPAQRQADAGRAVWLERARRDRHRLQTEKPTRYAIQLELACEVPSLTEAWKHDRPSGTMWLLLERHGGRECFRVLWGRYGSLDEARRAKSGVPSYFATPSNRPAVVRVR